MKNFSEYIENQTTDLNKAGDGYEALSDISKQVVDIAVNRYCEIRMKPAIDLLSRIKSHYSDLLIHNPSLSREINDVLGS